MKAMSPIEFAHRKNKILFNITGIILIPENQIKDCQRVKLNNGTNGTICTYCRTYIQDNCKNCPMSIANNKCGFPTNNTYSQVINKLDELEKDTICDLPEIIELVNKYNKQFEG